MAALFQRPAAMGNLNYPSPGCRSAIRLLRLRAALLLEKKKGRQALQMHHAAP